MSRIHTWLLIGPTVALIGLMLVVTFGPRARAAADHDRPTATHQLWSCSGVTCRPHGRPLGRTACELDAASLANTLPSGSKVTCQRVTAGSTR